MSNSLKHRLRAQSWQVNKRTFMPKDEVPEVVKLARLAHHEGQYERAIELVDSHETARNCEEGRTVKGLAYMGQSDYQAADEQFIAARALAKQAHNSCSSEGEKTHYRHRISVSYANEATSKIAQRDYHAASRLAKAALTANDQWHLPYVVKMSIERRQNQWQSLEKTLRDMISRWPSWRADPHFSERLQNDTDLAGVVQKLNELEEKS